MVSLKVLTIIAGLHPDHLIIKDYLSLVEGATGTPKGMLIAIAQRESSFRTDVIECRKDGGVGEKGMFQIRPKFHPGVDPCNAVEVPWYVASKLQHWKKRFNGSWRFAIYSYNWGEGNVRKMLRGKKQPPESVVNYWKAVQKATGIIEDIEI